MLMGGFVIAIGMVLGCFVVCLGGMFVVLGCLLVCFVGHWITSGETSFCYSGDPTPAPASSTSMAR
jgi:hypothetical protein